MTRMATFDEQAAMVALGADIVGRVRAFMAGPFGVGQAGPEAEQTLVGLVMVSAVLAAGNELPDLNRVWVMDGIGQALGNAVGQWGGAPDALLDRFEQAFALGHRQAVAAFAPQGGGVTDAPTLFDHGADRAAQARAMFPNQGLRDAASAIAFCGPRALQYLEQAPVLALGCAKVRRNRGVRVETSLTERRRHREILQFKMRPLCDRGAPLREVMAAFGFAFPLRRLMAGALGPSDAGTLLALSQIDPAVLGRIIPARAAAQKRWLGACFAFRYQLERRSRGLGAHPGAWPWAAEQMALARANSADALEVADLVAHPDGGFSPAWGWKRAREEHDRLSARATLAQMLAGTPFTPDTVLDLGPHPDVSEAEGFVFVALRTPRALMEEGAAMRHCVATYMRNVADGACHIVGVRQGDKRVATMEVVGLGPRDRGIVAARQLKGPCNAAVAPQVRTAATAWLRASFERLAGTIAP